MSMGNRAPVPEEHEHPDLVDVFYRPFVRPLGNLVVLFAQAEAALLEFVAALMGGDEKAASKFLKGRDKQAVISLAASSGLQDYSQRELIEAINGFWDDKEHRNRLMHDEWFIGLFSEDDSSRTVPILRGIPHRRGSELTWNQPEAQAIWELAERFRWHRSALAHAALVIRGGKLGLTRI